MNITVSRVPRGFAGVQVLRMRILLEIANPVLVVAFACLVLSVLRIRNLPAYVVGFYVVAYGDIVLVLQAAGLIGALNRPVTTIFQVVLVGAAAGAWLRAGRPPLWAAFSGVRKLRLPTNWQAGLRLVALTLLGLAVGYAYLRRAELILAIYPNNYDALTYHLSRVGYWLQYHSLYPWPTPNPRQTTFPMNAELGVLWTVLWTNTDRLSGFVQWLSVPAMVLGIYGITRWLGHSRWSSAIVALLFATLAQIVFQSSTTQNDLITAAFWIAAAYFFISGMREESMPAYALSGVAAGLAIGTKSTSLMFLPGFALGILVISLGPLRQRSFRRQFGNWIVACLAGTVLFGSYAYIQNTIAFGRVFGPVTSRTGRGSALPEGGFSTFANRLRDNLGRYAYQFFDFSTLPDPAPDEINPTKAAAFSFLFQRLGVPVENADTIALQSFDLQYINPLNEDTSWFGPLAIFLIPAAIAQVYQGIRRRDALRLGLVVIGLGLLLVQGALEAWTPYKGRYYILSAAILFPLIGCLTDASPWWRAALTLCLISLGVTTILRVTLDDPVLKQISWRDAGSASRKKIAWPEDFQYIMIKKNVPADASIGLTGGLDSRDYPFFGDTFTHYVTLAIPPDPELLPRGNMQRFVTDFQQSDYLLLSKESSASPMPAAPEGFDLLSEDGTSSTWIRSALRSSDECEDNNWPFRDFFQVSEDPVVCPRFPYIPSVAPGNESGSLYVPDGRFIPLINSSSEGHMKFDLLAKDATQARISVRVDPQGYTVPQTLQLALSQEDAVPQVYEVQFNKKDVLRFNVSLAQGVYTAEIGLASGPLEVRVLGIQVTAP